MVTVLKHVHFNKSSKSLYYISLASRFIILDNIITIIRFAYKRFPSRSCNLTGKSWTQFYFFLRKKDKRFFLYYDKLILFFPFLFLFLLQKGWLETHHYIFLRKGENFNFIHFFISRKKTFEKARKPRNRKNLWTLK